MSNLNDLYKCVFMCYFTCIFNNYMIENADILNGLLCFHCFK